VRLAADRAGLRGLGGRIQWVGLSCGNRQPRCRRPAFARWMHLSSRWHLRREMASTAFAPRMPPLFAMASMGGDGIYGVCTTLPPPCAMAWHLGVFTVKCHLAPGWHLWAEMASMALAPRCHLPVRWHLWRDMASMAGHRIYGGTWHLWRPRHCKMRLLRPQR
jgi:hypothetical protein